MQWLSINDVKLLVKKKLYQLETGSRDGDYLVYDRTAKTYVGHIEGAKYNDASETIESVKFFKQKEEYNPPRYIISEIETYKGSSEWFDGNSW